MERPQLVIMYRSTDAVSIPKRVSAKVEHTLALPRHPQHHVSIPKRVSAKVEHRGLQLFDPDGLVSIPKRVSAKVEPAISWGRYSGIDRFQSLKGFQPRWNVL